ncbi:MAG: GNAT family N-acetyltransferase [Caulobacter sp.]|nr:GNAT family N-acetyltransferase [Caulobacter sp.]
MTPRPARPDDAAAIARLHRLSMFTAMPWLADIHTPQEDLAFFRDVVLPAQTVRVVDGEGGLWAYAAWHEGWLNQLYVHPDHLGEGHGSRLLELAKAEAGSLQLWAFQRNARARAFYEAKGFRLVRLTDGSGNEEREPDVLYSWSRPDADLTNR